MSGKFKLERFFEFIPSIYFGLQFEHKICFIGREVDIEEWQFSEELLFGWTENKRKLEQNVIHMETSITR